MFHNPERDNSVPAAVGPLVVSALVLVFCRDLLLTDGVPFFRDLATYFYPLRFALYESYGAGTIPLWNRHMGMGFPLLADFQSGAFYPPHLLLAALPFFPAIRLLFILHFLIAGLGSWLLFRHWRYPVPLAVIGALLFTLGGTTVALTNLLNHFQTAVWLPWMILTWERSLAELSWRAFVVSVLVWAAAFLGGSPEIFALCLGLVFLDGLRIKAAMPARSYGKALLLLAATGLVLTGLVMAQALPTAELFWESRRQTPILYQEALYWSLNPANLLNLFLVDKVIDPSVATGMRLFFLREGPFLVSYYLGVFCFFGIGFWLYGSSRRERLVLLGLIAVSLVFALGDYTPIYPFIRALPLLSAVRFPEKFFFVTFALLIYVAMRGAEWLLRERAEIPKTAYAVIACLCLPWVGVYAYFRADTVAVVELVTKVSGLPPSSDTMQVAADILLNLERQLILTLGFSLLFVLATARAVRPALLNVLLVAAVFIDLAWAHKDFLFLVSPDVGQQSGRVLRASDVNGYRLFYSASARNLHPGFVSIAGRPSFAEATALTMQNLLPNAGIIHGFDYMQEIDALGRRPYAEFLSFANELDFERQLKFLRLWNVGYIISFRELSGGGIRLAGSFPQYYSWVYKVDGSVPRAYVVNRVTAVGDSAAVLPLLSDARFDPAREAVVEGNTAITGDRSLIASAEITRYEDARVSLAVASNQDAMLVLADSYYPGWRAYLDGKQTKVLRTNHFFRGVVVPAGTHSVEFKYEPRSFTLGVTVSLLTVCMMAAISFSRRFRKPRSLPSPRILNGPSPSATEIANER